MKGKNQSNSDDDYPSARPPANKGFYPDQMGAQPFYAQYMMPFAHPSSVMGSQHLDHVRDGSLRTPPGTRDPNLMQNPGVPPFYPMYMPMPGYPYFPPYFPQPYNYMQNYSPMKDRSNDRDTDRNEKVDRKTTKPTKPIHLKTSDEIVNEFKSQTLPKLRLKRLIKIQAVMKGWYTRKFLLPRKKFMDKILRELTQKKINEFLEDRIIPDLVLEVVTLNKYNKDYTLYSQGLRNYLEITDSVIDKLVRSMCRDVVRETTNNLAFEFLRMKKGELVEYDTDPFSLVAKSLITNFVKKNMEMIARECITDMVNEYMLESQFNKLMKTKYIPNMLKETADDAAKEVAIEEILNQLLERMIRELAPAMFESQYEEVVQEVENAELQKGLKNHIKRGVLRALIDSIATIVIVKAEKEQIADEMMQKAQVAYLDEEGLALRE